MITKKQLKQDLERYKLLNANYAEQIRLLNEIKDILYEEIDILVVGISKEYQDKFGYSQLNICYNPKSMRYEPYNEEELRKYISYILIKYERQ